jgi:hypothetical protein
MIVGEVNTTGAEFTSHNIGSIDFIFSVNEYPAIVVADSSRDLPTRSAGLLDGKARITVPNIENEIGVHCKGIGVGYLSAHRITRELNSGGLIALSLKDHENRRHDLYIVWGEVMKVKHLHGL